MERTKVDKGVDVGRQQVISAGVGFRGGWTTGRRTMNKVHSGDDGGRSQGGDRRVQGGSDRERTQGGHRRDPEQEEPDKSQAAAMMTTHGGADGGRSLGGGRADDSRGRPTAVEQVEVEPEAETESR
ncbi:Required for respiratory growth protein 9, mitochondrial [Labeo rohita]|uniref:Required for respiratory growth protein 9, mitochondrial n=1 Tax=Labeo rohita TaxID=84645 RepID=A0ABQ8LXF3_LABRO|nr:Required for respiratory growth protein 9, mitochondrial [Labeo rohita]